MPNYSLNVDGALQTVQAEVDEPLLYALTDKLNCKPSVAELRGILRRAWSSSCANL